jgi:hypothetical protein
MAYSGSVYCILRKEPYKTQYDDLNSVTTSRSSASIAGAHLKDFLKYPLVVCYNVRCTVVEGLQSHALTLVFFVFFMILVRSGCDMGDVCAFVLSRGFVCLWGG